MGTTRLQFVGMLDPIYVLCAVLGLVVLFKIILPGKREGRQRGSSFVMIEDKYSTLEEVQTALRSAGLESSSLVLGIDYTRSNEYNGTKTFGGKCLHDIDFAPNGVQNPYQQVISLLGRTLAPFDDDNLIPAFGFGDRRTTDRSVFPLRDDGAACNGFEEVLSRYNEVTPLLTLSGPTSFEPIIYAAINVVKEEGGYHILVIVCDGQVVNERVTRDAIVEASKYPLSIITIGVGDGPWELMREFDDQLPARTFDNFQFVEWHDVVSRASSCKNPEAAIATAILQEIPDQYRIIRSLNML